MEQYKEIVARLEKDKRDYPRLSVDVNDLVEGASYRKLQKIRRIIETEGLSDFEIVEDVIHVIEETGLRDSGDENARKTVG